MTAVGEQSLVVWQDDHVLLFVPKAQVSQWEIQLMVIADGDNGSPVGNVIEADALVRRSLDAGILKAQQVLAGLGATMVTAIEYSKRIGVANGQRLLYAFLPKLPWSMGAFSEAQGTVYPWSLSRGFCRRLSPAVALRQVFHSRCKKRTEDCPMTCYKKRVLRQRKRKFPCSDGSRHSRLFNG